MKLISILIIFLGGTFSLKVWSQNSTLNFPGNQSLYKLETQSKGQQPVMYPSRDSERIKIKHHFTRDSSTYVIYTKEYLNNSQVKDSYEFTQCAFFMKGHDFSWEIVPDTSSLHYFKVFTFFPGAMSVRQKFTNEDNYFSYKQFKYDQTAEYGKEIPLLIIYEDDLKSRKAESLIRQFLDKDGLIDLEKVVFPYDKINRYVIVSYVLNAKE